ncbi:cytochrome b/b6 domain-containing protein [Salinarimonas ramus]|uniref:Cytochrome b561 n=1 Tax=Salinarimonas ramus TaxID=690164 RepID=A0A917Q6C3_9HYPH|nr:cytochrome b/b6 domain-containing protein [Salinarimonas ramus]GGK29764.1 cytochrome b561 [Salinarimonas ramus]
MSAGAKTDDPEAARAASDVPGTIRVWDPLVRIGHWALAAAFLVAYLSEGEPMSVHQVAGYAALFIVVVRIGWGFVGPRRARFSDFVAGPGAVLRYLKGLATGTAPRYVGHSPAGGAMTLALLVCILGTAVTGVARLAVEEGEGPLAPFVAPVSAQVESLPALPTIAFVAPARADDDDAWEGGERGEESVIGEAHELFANLDLALVLLHLGGVAVAGVVHRENLVGAMITGRKRA